MKIAQVVCTFPPYYGGMGNVAFELSSGLAAKGHDVVVYTPEFGPHKEEEFSFARRLKPSLRYGNSARLPKLYKKLEDADIIHLHYPFFGTANIVRRFKLKHPHIPLVVSYHMDTRAPGFKGLVFAIYAKFWLAKILAVADAVIASTFDYIEKSDAQTIFASERSKWKEIPFGVNTERFGIREKPVELFLKHDLDRKNPTLLFVGAMDIAHEFKGVPILLQAMKILQKTIPDLQLVLVGDGELRRQFEMFTRVLHLQNIRFAGRVKNDQLANYYNMADLLVLPSVHQGEAFGMVLLEAFASGVPVVASDIPGVRTIACRAGMTVEKNNPVSLAEGIQAFLSLSFDAKENLKKQAREVAVQDFSWGKVVQMTLDLYTELLAKK